MPTAERRRTARGCSRELHEISFVANYARSVEVLGVRRRRAPKFFRKNDPCSHANGRHDPAEGDGTSARTEGVDLPLLERTMAAQSGLCFSPASRSHADGRCRRSLVPGSGRYSTTRPFRWCRSVTTIGVRRRHGAEMCAGRGVSARWERGRPSAAAKTEDARCRSDKRVDMRIDMRVDMCIDMRIDGGWRYSRWGMAR